MKHAFHLMPNYTGITIWNFNPKTGERISVSTLRAEPGQTRRSRYDLMCFAIREKGMQPPQYQLTEQRQAEARREGV